MSSCMPFPDNVEKFRIIIVIIITQAFIVFPGIFLTDDQFNYMAVVTQGHTQVEDLH